MADDIKPILISEAESRKIKWTATRKYFDGGSSRSRSPFKTFIRAFIQFRPNMGGGDILYQFTEDVYVPHVLRQDLMAEGKYGYVEKIEAHMAEAKRLYMAVEYDYNTYRMKMLARKITSYKSRSKIVEPRVLKLIRKFD